MKNNRVNIDRDVQSRKNIAATRTAPIHREEPKPVEPPRDEPKEDAKEEVKVPETETEAAPLSVPKPKRQGRQTEGDA